MQTKKEVIDYVAASTPQGKRLSFTHKECQKITFLNRSYKQERKHRWKFYTSCPLLQLDVEKCWPKVLKEELAETMEEKHIINNNFNNSDRLPLQKSEEFQPVAREHCIGLGAGMKFFQLWSKRTVSNNKHHNSRYNSLHVQDTELNS